MSIEGELDIIGFAQTGNFIQEKVDQAHETGFSVLVTKIIPKDKTYDPIYSVVQVSEGKTLAAPNMYEALKAFDDYLTATHPHNMRLKALAVNLMEKALAKAEGKNE